MGGEGCDCGHAGGLQLPDQQQRSNAVQAIMNDLVQKDPSAALAWMNQLPAGKMRTQAEQNYAINLAGKDPKAASDYVDGMPNGQEKNNVIINLAYQWPKTMPRPRWPGRRNFPTRSGGALPVAGHVQLGAKRSQGGGGLPGQRGPMGQEKETWCEIWPPNGRKATRPGALTWAQALPGNREKSDALQQITATWAQNDPQAATAYVEGLPAGSVRNESSTAWSFNWPVRMLTRPWSW